MQDKKLINIIPIRKITDPRGNLSVCEAGEDIHFEIKRVYWMYEIPDGEDRGAHAHKALRQVIVAMHGSFEVTLDNGHERETVTLSNPWEGLVLEPGTWRTLQNFSEGAVCMVLASEHYDKSDYIRDYDTFISIYGSK